MNPAQQIFEDAVWRDACRLYADDMPRRIGLHREPQSVQDEYRERARQELRTFLAECGIV